MTNLLLARLARIHARRQYRAFARCLHQAASRQERILFDLLRRNADSDFGRQHGFSKIRSYHDFASQVPIQRYEDIRPYVEKVMAGKTDALLGSGQPVVMFATTSGTTERPKYVPVTPRFLSDYRRGWHVFGFKALLDHPEGFTRPILQAVSRTDDRRTANGIPCGAISGLLAATQKRIVRRYYVAPPAMTRITDADARYYAIMRLAVPRDVGWMVTASPATQLRLARTAAEYTERLIRDVRDGTLTLPGEVPAAVRESIEATLSPNPVAAKRLTGLTDQHGELRPKDYWNLAFMANWTGGTLALHLQDFPYYFGDTPVRDIGLLATEGRVSIPLDSGTPAGVLDVAGSFFEFVDAEAKPGEPDAVLRCHELAPGHDYRVVMTTAAGFYRYDLGDYVRVKGYVGEAPLIEFLHRGAHVSSVTGEKLTEWQVTTAFGRACRSLGSSVDTFVLAPVWDDPPFYRLHLERNVAHVDRLAASLDAALSELNIEYASKRRSRRLGGITINRLPAGTLLARDAQRLARSGGAAEQFKHKYLLTVPGEDAPLIAAGVAAGSTTGNDGNRAG